MRILFWGTPDFALPSLQALLGEGHDVVGVVTQPDRPAGRGREMRQSPVKQYAHPARWRISSCVKERLTPVMIRLKTACSSTEP